MLSGGFLKELWGESVFNNMSNIFRVQKLESSEYFKHREGSVCWKGGTRK